MAKVGFEYIKAGKLDDSAISAATASYSDAREIGPGATVTITPSSADVKDYGDDRTVETDVSVTGGTVSLELNEPTLDNEAWILGHEITEEGGMLRKTDDIPPYVGLGFVGKSRKNGAVIYRVKIYYKTQFMEPTAEYQTKEDSVTFNHTTLEGNLFELEDDKAWNVDLDFDTLADAKSYIDEFFGETSDSGNTEPDDENP